MKSCVFCSNRIRTLVAMATSSSHRLIMGKEEIQDFFCLVGDTPQPLYNTVRYNMVLDITRISVGPQMSI